MYIEKKGNHHYLVKKIAGKKITINIGNYQTIFQEDLDKLSQKEFETIQNLKTFQDFKTELYHPEMLDTVYLNSLFLGNQLGSGLSNTKLKKKYNDFPIKFIYNSNHIEGSKIPEEEVEKIIKNKKYTYKIKNEIQEVKNSFISWEFLNSQFTFNKANIKKIYHILTKDLLQENGLKYPRGFKKVSIVVNNNTTSSPENVDGEIEQLLGEYKKNLKEINPIKLAFDFHLKYEQIHPFENGNGRTGRLLMNKILIQHNMLPMIVYKENYKAYSSAIASCNSGNKKKYYKFMLEQYLKTIKDYWK